jgi:hypothetical protein
MHTTPRVTYLVHSECSNSDSLSWELFYILHINILIIKDVVNIFFSVACVLPLFINICKAGIILYKQICPFPFMTLLQTDFHLNHFIELTVFITASLCRLYFLDDLIYSNDFSKPLWADDSEIIRYFPPFHGVFLTQMLHLTLT